MITIERIDDIVVNGGIVVTSDGHRIGSIEQVFLSDESGEPAFVTVRTGLFGMSESFVPLAGATVDGSRILVAYDKDRIRSGPRIESDRGAITADEERALYLYYGMETAGAPEAVPDEAWTGAASPDTTGTGTTGTGTTGTGATSPGTAGPAVSPPPRPHPAPPPPRPHPQPPHAPPLHAPPLHEGPRPGPHPGPHAVPPPPPPHEGAHPGPPTPPHLRRHVVEGQPHRPPSPRPHPPSPR